MTDASSTTIGVDTPSTARRVSGSWSDHKVIPYPEATFQIIEKRSGRAITLVGDEARLLVRGDTNQLHTYWHCVKQDGYFGFYNAHTGRYLGHDGKDGVHAAVSHLKGWELWTPREHPDGGYELLSPYYFHTLMVLCVDGDGSALVRRRHGTTLWEFVRVSETADKVDCRMQ